MELARIAELLQPFLGVHNASTSSDHRHSSSDHRHSSSDRRHSSSDRRHSSSDRRHSSSGHCHSEERSDEEPAFLSPAQLQSISTYIDILLRWNARINLTAIRNPEDIVTRHFGESLFAARHLFPRTACGRAPTAPLSLADIGSGAGFPGLPIKLWAPQISLTLIESNHKKATFLREVARALTLTDINIQNVRADKLLPLKQHQATEARQDFEPPFDIVTLRAVERFPAILPQAATLVAPAGRLTLLIGSAQQPHVLATLPTFLWSPPIPVPLSKSRILLIGTREPQK